MSPTYLDQHWIIIYYTGTFLDIKSDILVTSSVLVASKTNEKQISAKMVKKKRKRE